MNRVKEKVAQALWQHRRSEGKSEDIKLLNTYSSVGEMDVSPYKLVTTSVSIKESSFPWKRAVNAKGFSNRFSSVAVVVVSKA